MKTPSQAHRAENGSPMSAKSPAQKSSTLSTKSPEMIAAIESLFPGTQAAIKMGNCPLCSKPVVGFKDLLSAREFEISGMCQQCQDSIWNESGEEH